jgi:uncharacterized protein DUF6483
MIRRDYFIRMVQELTQALSRVVFLKRAGEFARASQEIERTLVKFWKLSSEQIESFSLEQWIEQCRQEEGPMGEKLIALADLFSENADLQAIEKADQSIPPQKSSAIALGLYLEAVATPETIISTELLDKIEKHVEKIGDFRLPPDILKRLLSYYETRGMLDKAEDVLFDWLDKDADAAGPGLAFYERLRARSDQELERGGLPRAEVEEGRQELLSRAKSAPQPD